MSDRHLIDAWHDELVLELRLREVPGAVIGDALAEVDAHCAATGESPEEAFGAPPSYADAVADAVGARRRGSGHVLTLALVGLSSVLAVLEAAAGVGAGGTASITVGELVGVAVGSLSVAVVFALLARTRGVLAWLVVSLLFTVTVLPQLIWRAELVTLPAWSLLVAGAVGLAATWWPRPADRVVDPRTGREPWRPRRALDVVRWAPVVVLVVAVGVVLVVPSP